MSLHQDNMRQMYENDYERTGREKCVNRFFPGAKPRYECALMFLRRDDNDDDDDNVHVLYFVNSARTMHKTRRHT